MASEFAPRTEPSAPLAALDLGSNSFHLIVAREVGEQLQIVDRHRERVALGAGLDSKKNLDLASQKRALAALERFAQRVWEIAPERIRVVATNTLRVAKNAEAFLAQAEAALGVPIEVISGAEEARLTWHGVMSDLPTTDERRLLIDIGGGSTECVLGSREGVLFSDSLQLGCVSMSAAIFDDGKLNPNRFKRARRRAMAELQTIAQGYLKKGWAEAYGSSGTINAIAKYLDDQDGTGQVITAEGLRGLENRLADLGHCDALVEKGFREDRARVIPGGIAVLRGVFKVLKINKLLASSSALREGVLTDLIGRIHHKDIRERAIRALMWRFHVDASQAGRVEAAVKSLTDGLKLPSALDQDYALSLLSWAARTHEIGLNLSYSGYHKHSAYLALHSELDGFSQADQRRLAYLLLSHRRKWRELAQVRFIDISAKEIEALKPLAIILRLAVLLMRSRREETVDGVRIKSLSNKGAVLDVRSDWLDQHQLAALDLEDEAKRLADYGIILEIHAD